jgi:phenylacetate-CoA ligase
MYSNFFLFFKKYILRGHRDLRHALRALEQTQWLSRQDLEVLQLKKLQKLVSYAFVNVPFYHERYQREGINPLDIKRLSDFQSLPFLTRKDVIDNFKSLISTVYRGNTYEDTTGGSTGEPMRFIMDVSALKESDAVEIRCRGWYGVKSGDRMAWIRGNLKELSGLNWRARLGVRLRRRRYLNSRTMDDYKMQDFADMLLKWQPAIIYSYPSALHIYANYLKENNILNIRPKLVEVGGEKIKPEERQLFEQVFHAPVADYYGAWESGVIAYQCPHGALHIIENRYLELVSGDKVVSPGQMGEIVVTPLNQYAMPFIRYKNDDVGIFESEKCSCGRGMPVLREVVGRNSDLLVNPDGRLVHWSSFYTIIRYKPEIYQAQLYQPDREHIEVRVVCKEKVSSTLLENIRKELQPCFGERMNISVNLVDHIQLTPAGKLRFIISDVKPDGF